MSDGRNAEGPTIFVSAYRSPSMRYLVYSGIVPRLVDAGARVVLFVADYDVESYRKRFATDGILVESVLLDAATRLTRGTRRARFLVLFRKCTSGRSRDLRNPTDALRRVQYRMDGPKTVPGRLQTEAAIAASVVGERSRWVRKGLAALESRLFPGSLYDAYFERYDPDLLVTSSLGYMIDPLFMRAAHRHGVPTTAVIHSWDNPSSKDYRGAEPTHVVTWNTPMSREVEVFHDIPRASIVEGGIAHWDFLFDGSWSPRPRGEVLAAHGADPGKRTVLYGTSAPTAVSGTFDAIDDLAGRIGRGELGAGVQLLVRLHPEYLTGKRVNGVPEGVPARIRALEAKHGALLRIHLPRIGTGLIRDVPGLSGLDMGSGDLRELAELLASVDVLVTEYSTLIIEAAIADVPVVNVGYLKFRSTDRPAAMYETFTHLQRILATGASPVARSPGELAGACRRYLADRKLDADRRKALVAQEITTNPGSAARRIADLVLAQAARSAAARASKRVPPGHRAGRPPEEARS